MRGAIAGLVRLCAFGLVATAASLGGAHAQTKTVDIPASAYGPVWTGFYVGAAFGVESLLDRANLATAGGANLNFDGLAGRGALGSIYGGVDYQVLPKALVGALAEVSYGGVGSNAYASLPGASATFSTHADLSWAALVRAGVLPRPSTLLYVVGGYAGQNIAINATAQAGNAFAAFSQYATFNGWTAGVGIESRLHSGWSTKLEYRYSQYGQQTLPGTMISLSPSTQVVRFGLNYRFGQPADDKADETAGERPVNWTGLYGGVAGGAGLYTSHNSATLPGVGANADTGAQGVLGSVLAGADYQFSDQAVVGVMGDITWPDMPQTNTSLVGSTMTTVSRLPTMGWSVLGRVGFLPTPSTLIYAAGGFTSMRFNTSVTAPAAGVFINRDDTANGWTVGPGVEIQVSDGWSTRLEYRYSEYAQVTPANGVSFQPSMQSIRAGFIYRIGVGH